MVKTDSNRDSQDRAHAEPPGLRSDLQQQEIRTADLEAATREHSGLHEGTLLRVAELEKQVEELKRQDQERTRFPTPAGRGTSRDGRGRSPSQPRSPRDDRDPEEDLEIVIGGWTRRQDVEHEVV